jgi:hypothetical protein
MAANGVRWSADTITTLPVGLAIKEPMSVVRTGVYAVVQRWRANAKSTS